ncbi:MAG TPA: helix-turn-helix domain-containing protein [Drouetiella sp.]
MVRTLDQSKRAAIIDAAKAIFKRDGYSAAKMSDIASTAGVAPGTLYLYFASKESLASAIGEEFFSGLMSKFGDILGELTDPDGVLVLVDWAVQISEQERDYLAMARERRKDPKSTHDLRQKFISRIADQLTDLAKRGIIRKYSNVQMQAEMLMAMMRRIIMSSVIFGDETVDDLRTGAIETLQHALFDDVTLAAHELLKRNKRK